MPLYLLLSSHNRSRYYWLRLLMTTASSS